MAPPAASDDPSIFDEHELWRRIRPDWVIYDSNTQSYRPSTAAFQNSSGVVQMSVVLGQEHGDAEGAVSRQEHLGYSLASVTARVARDCDQTMQRSPAIDEPHHGDVSGLKPYSIQKKFVRASEWRILRPRDVVGVS
jgi:hypothetical protein